MTMALRSDAQARASLAETSAPEDVLGSLRRRIVRHEFPPGSWLREQALAEEYGVSRARIRDAFAILEHLNFVVREPNRGAMVRRPSLDELVQLFRVREALEGMAARLATENATPESWQDLVDLFGAPTAEAVANGEIETFLLNYDALRRRILEGCANPALLEALSPLYDRTSMIMRRLVFATDRARQALKEHSALLAAMRRGDADEADRQKRLNLRSASLALQRYHEFLI